MCVCIDINLVLIECALISTMMYHMPLLQLITTLLQYYNIDVIDLTGERDDKIPVFNESSNETEG